MRSKRVHSRPLEPRRSIGFQECPTGLRRRRRPARRGDLCPDRDRCRREGRCRWCLDCRGVGRQGLLSVDALNVVVAPLVFFVMAKSNFWFIELQAEREEQGLPLLDLDRDPVNALKFLEDSDPIAPTWQE
jgi:hypothetical protein